MACGLTNRPLLLKVNDDDESTNYDFPLSVHKVLSNDDLLMEIFLRLPIHSLNLFKPVCKQWLSLIKSPRFTLTRTRIPTADPPSGLFIRRFLWNSHKTNYDFVSFDPRTPTKRSIEPSVDIGLIEQSSNGLLLCNISCNNYSVCNPSTSMIKMLPPIHTLYYERNCKVNMAFDPTESPWYKVVHVGSIEYDEILDMGPYYDSFYRVQIYSSETGVWSVLDDSFFSELFNDRYPFELFSNFSDGIYLNGAIHWLDLLFGEPCLLKFDIADHPVLTSIQHPLSQVHCDRKLFKSDHGSLLLLCKIRDPSRHLYIYEIKSESYVWSVKYFVNLDHIMRPYPTWRMPTKSSVDTLSIVLGERDEDSFMVIEMSGKILQYKFMLETVTELFDLRERDEGSFVLVGCFEYIASFAHV